MIHSGLNLREALDAARRLGCSIAVVAGTGELTVSHPAWPRRVRFNRRRRSAPRELTGLLMRLEREAIPRRPPTYPPPGPPPTFPP